MRKLTPLLAICLSLMLVGAAPGSTPAIGYLSPDKAPDTLRILPPAPAAGDSRDLSDQAVFRQTRKLENTPRWALAQGDIDERAILRDFACAVGVELTPARAPRLAGLLTRAREDVRRATNLPKDHYGRKRPYLASDGPICAPKTPDLAASPDYPSGHSSWGWTVALILAELAPDRATDILVRGRSFGESRVVCGVHGLAAVDAGRTNASAVVAALHGDADFRADLEAARAEVKAAREGGPSPDGAACLAQDKLVEKTPY